MSKIPRFIFKYSRKQVKWIDLEERKLLKLQQRLQLLKELEADQPKFSTDEKKPFDYFHAKNNALAKLPSISDGYGYEIVMVDRETYDAMDPLFAANYREAKTEVEAAVAEREYQPFIFKWTGKKWTEVTNENKADSPEWTYAKEVAIEYLKDKVKELETKNIALSAQLQDLLKSTAEGADEVRKTANKGVGTTAADSMIIEVLKDKVKALETRNSYLSAQLQDLLKTTAEEADEVRKTTKQLKEENAALKDKVKELETKILTRTTEIEILREVTGKRREQLDEKTSLYEMAQKQIEELRKENAALNNQLTEARKPAMKSTPQNPTLSSLVGLSALKTVPIPLDVLVQVVPGSTPSGYEIAVQIVPGSTSSTVHQTTGIIGSVVQVVPGLAPKVPGSSSSVH